MLFSTLYGRYLCRAVVGTLKRTWDVMNDLHAAEFENDGIEVEEGRAAYGR